MKNLLLSAFLGLTSSIALGQNPQLFDVINPIGDENLGVLLVKSPKEMDASNPQIVPFALSVGPYKNGSKSTLPADVGHRMLKGQYCVDVQGPIIGGNLFEVQNCDVVVTPKQTTTLQLAALKVDWDPSNLQVDFGPKPKIEFTGKYFSVGADASQNWLAGLNYTYLPLFAETITATPSLPILGTTKFVVNEGELHTEKMQFSDVRATVEVLPPQRSFEDSGDLHNCPSESTTYLVHRDGTWTRDERFHVPGITYGLLDSADNSGNTALVNSIPVDPEKGGKFYFFPNDGVTSLNYELVVNNTWMQLHAQPGESLKIQLKRIDVNDVLLTREDGSTSYVSGRFVVYTQDSKGGWHPLEVTALQGCPGRNTPVRKIMTSFQTKTGLDVLPGIYKVVTTYSTQEGQKTDEQVVDLR